MDYQLSDRINAIQPSPTLAVTQKANELRQQGKDVIGLGVGEPDFDTPDFIKDAAIQAIHDGKTKYTAVDGIDELKDAVIKKLKRDNSLSYQRSEIIVSAGGKHSIFNLLSAWLNPGDEVVIPAPYWVSYPDMTKLVGATPVIVKAGIDQRFKITPEQLRNALTDKTRLMFINSPSNPAGTAYTANELEALAEVLRDYPNVLIATDDMYEHLVWSDSPFANFPMKKMQSQSTSNPASISQYAAAAALNGDQSCIKTMVTAFKERHDYLVDALNSIDGIDCVPGDGTFYAFAQVDKLMAKANVSSDVELCEKLLTEANVALVPGSAFGTDGYCRLSFATGMDVLKEAVKRIKSFSESL